MRRTLGAVQLTALGIGAIIGAGIFAAIGTAISGDAGHVGAGAAIVVSIVLAGVTSALAAITYSEFAAMIPISGSAYTYAYATLGELVAWIIGWDLILEYAVGNIAVAIGWAGYFDSLLRGLGVELPRWLVTDILTARHDPALLASVPHLGPIPLVFNLPAFGIVAIITWLLVIGTRETAWVNTVMVVIKVAIIGLFLVVGVAYVRPQQWSTPAFAPNGLAGISVGAAIIFFSYIGFDAVSTAAEEARNPQRDIPRGIIWSLIICTALYAAIAPIGVVLELTNIGTLFAFILVALGIIVLRRTDPKRPRPFRTPWVPFLPIVSILFCVYLIVSLPTLTKVRFVAWLVAGAVIYFLYSVRHSRVRREGEVRPPVGGEPA